MRMTLYLVAALVLGNCLQQVLMAAYVEPQIIGGSESVSDPNASMKHIEVALVGNQIQLTVDDTVPTPLLRALEEPDEFDPTKPWAVLQDKAHNFQYGWLIGGFWVPPSGSGVWVELLDSTEGLETYSARVPLTGSYDPIFGTEGSSPLWQWGGMMIHNAYAVLDPTLTAYEATYRVYIGDAVSGSPTPGYQGGEVTLTFGATPNLTADFNDDTFVDDIDLATWQQNYGEISQVTPDMGDANSDGTVDGFDFLAWQSQFTGGGVTTISVVPEPSTGLVALLTMALSSCYRSCGRESWGQHRC